MNTNKVIGKFILTPYPVMVIVCANVTEQDIEENIETIVGTTLSEIDRHTAITELKEDIKKAELGPGCTFNPEAVGIAPIFVFFNEVNVPTATINLSSFLLS